MIKKTFHILSFLGACLICGGATIWEDQSKAVILAYGQTEGEFQAHLQEIEKSGTHVLPLPDILKALEKGAPLPPRALALTFEGAYAAHFQTVFPLLLKKHIPFTVFYNDETLNQNLPEMARAQDLQALTQNKLVTLGVIPAAAPHTEEDIIASLNAARTHYRKLFGREVDILSYPNGQYSTAFQKLAKKQGFRAALTLDSGAAHAGSDPYALPRFDMREGADDLEYFAHVVEALPLPVTEREPADPFLGAQDWRMGFTLPQALAPEAEKLSCVIKGEAPPQVQILGSRIEIRPTGALSHPDHVRLECLLPAPPDSDDTPRWRWLGVTTTGVHEAATPNPAPDAPPALLE